MEIELLPTLYVQITAGGLRITLSIAEARELRDWLLAEASITPAPLGTASRRARRRTAEADDEAGR